MKIRNTLPILFSLLLTSHQLHADECDADSNAGMALVQEATSSNAAPSDRINMLRSYTGNTNCLPLDWYFQLGLSYQEVNDYKKSRLALKQAKFLSKNSNNLNQAALISANYAKSGWLDEKNNGRAQSLAIWRNEAEEANLLFRKSEMNQPDWFQDVLLEMDNWMKDANADVMLSQLDSQNPEFARSYGVEQGLSLMILFEKGKDQLKPNGKLQLDRLSQALVEKISSGGSIKIVGHASSEGDANKNIALSENRARQVELYLLSKSSSLEGKTESNGIGASELRFKPDNTEAFRAGNRRVEVFIQ